MRNLVAVVVVIAGVIALAISGRLIYVRRQQNRQKSTATRMYQIRAALTRYSEANGGLLPPPAPNAAAIALPPPVVRVEATVSWLTPFIATQFSRRMPETDGWERPLYCSITSDRRHFMIVSLGRDGKPDPSISDMWSNSDFDRDLIMVDGTFVSAPRGWAH